jgi:Family of unknown function (DUF6088)
MTKVQPSIEHSISRRKPGELVFPTDFRGQGTEDAIKQSLSRLTKAGKLTRLAHGIYFIPKTDPLLGTIYPSAEEVAKMLAKKERVNIRPAGAYALHKLGLTTQVPTKLVYITDGPSRLIKVGKTTIKFKATANKKLATKGKISSLLIQALEELEPKEIDEKTKIKILELLKKESPRLLKHDLSLAPARVHDYIIKLLKEESNDGMAAINR